MLKELGKQGGKIEKIYTCPHGWNDNCDCRKPKPGLLHQAAAENSLDLSKVVFIGDDERDAEAGESAGCKTLLVEENKNLWDLVKNLS